MHSKQASLESKRAWRSVRDSARQSVTPACSCVSLVCSEFAASWRWRDFDDIIQSNEQSRPW